MKAEMFELEQNLQAAGHAMGVLHEALAIHEMEELAGQLAKPVMGTAAFIKRMEVELKEAQSVKAPAEPAAVAAAAAQAIPPFKPLLAVAFVAGAGVFAAAVGAGLVMPRLYKAPPAVKADTVRTEVNAAPAAKSVETAAAPRLVLDGSTWDVRIIPMAKEESARIENDTLAFSGNTVESRSLLGKGFTPTHYNLTVNADGGITWETMQTSAAGEVVSWRGEWRGDQMKGVLSYRVNETENRNFNFIGVLKGGANS